MIKKVVTKRKLSETSDRDDVAYWLSRPPEERIAAVEFLGKQHYGEIPPTTKSS